MYFMLISCNSCNSKYLVNSADLKPSGRKVQCAKCGKQWFQESVSLKEESFNTSKSFDSKISENETNSENKKYNLPSTYVEEQNVSIVNSVLVVFFLILIIFIFWFLSNVDINTLVLLKYYMNEFFFNLKLIANDIAKIIHKIVDQIKSI